jgi:2-iminoacetate synthase
LVEFGEDPINNPIDYAVEVIKTIYQTKSGKGEIRRVNVNLAATTVDNYRKLKEVGIGTYQLFQETYHKDTYEKMHRGPKADYQRQLSAHDLAFQAGLDDLGLGVLFGLYDYKFEVLALVSHAQYLDKTYGVGPHTFSVPRWRPAETVAINPKHQVSEDKLLKIIAILRLAVPYTGMIISTRERPEVRAKAFEIGISQTSAASKTAPGGYSHNEPVKQFETFDQRTLDDVLKSILKQGLLPSFCTACYRQGRTGHVFMELAKPGNIHNLCRPNAILTFKEYLEDYASPEVKESGQKIINQYFNQIDDKQAQQETKVRLQRIENGERDLYF